MEYVSPLSDWLAHRIDKSVTELSGLPIKQQIQTIDQAGSGIGFVFLLEMVSTDTESDNPATTHLAMLSVPIVKIRNVWMTMADENLADILASIVRLAGSQLDKEGFNGTDTESPRQNSAHLFNRSREAS